MTGTTGTPVSALTSSVGYLIPHLRLRIGDTTATAYRYEDAWLLTALESAVQSLQRYWNYKYLIDDAGNVTRNPNFTKFLFPETDGIIEKGDENTIVVMAAIIVLEGSLENSAWNVSIWRDAEISYSSVESGKLRNETLKRLVEELNSLVKPPMKRLAQTKKGSLPGFLGNDYEHKTSY